MIKTSSPHELQSALLFLLSRFAREQKPDMIPMIVDHFYWLANHPALADCPQLKKTCQQLGQNWKDGLYRSEGYRMKVPLDSPVH